MTDLDAVTAGHPPGDQARLGRDADQPLPQDRRHPRRGRPRQGPPGPCSSSTTPSPRPTCSSRSALGADLVLHSTTKYLGGHSDVVGGVVVGNDPEIYETLKFHQNAAGAVPGPFDCWLTLRGIKTLGVRMERHSANARAVAEFLRDHDAVERGLLPRPARPPRPRRSPPGRCATSPAWSRSPPAAASSAASRSSRKTKVFTLAESLGGVEIADRAPRPDDPRQRRRHRRRGRANLVRLSVGIEHDADLIADLRQALEAVVPAISSR